MSTLSSKQSRSQKRRLQKRRSQKPPQLQPIKIVTKNDDNTLHVIYKNTPIFKVERWEDNHKLYQSEIIMEYLENKLKESTENINKRIDELNVKMDRLLDMFDYSPDGGPEFEAAQERWNNTINEVGNEISNNKKE